MRRWQGHGWSRLSHGVHTGGGLVRITVTLVSVGATQHSRLLSLSPEGPVIFSALNKLMVEAAGLHRCKMICTQKPAVNTAKKCTRVSYNLTLQIRLTIK